MYILDDIAQTTDLNWTEKAVYSLYYYFTFSGQSHCCRLTNETICNRLGLTERTLQRIKNSLKTKNHIEVKGITVKALVRYNGVTEMSPIANNSEGDRFDTHSEGVTELTPIADEGIKSDTFDTHSEPDQGVTNVVVGVTKTVEGVTNLVVRGDTFDTHNKENRDNRDLIEDIEHTSTEGTMYSNTPDLSKFYLSFGKFLSKAPEMGLKDLYTNFGVYKKKLESTLKGEALESNLASITEQFNSVLENIKRDNPIHQVVTRTTEFDTLVSKAFVVYEKWKLDDTLPRPGQLQLINQNLATITKECGQDTADTYFKLYVNTVLAWGVPTEKLIRNWNLCVYNERYQLVQVDNESL